MGAPATNTLGEEWEYVAAGAASSGFGVDANGIGHGNLCGSTVCNGQALDDAAYGLLGFGTDLSPQGLQADKNAYVEDSVTIDITLASNSIFTLANITSVQFQFGTGNGEGSITVPRCTGGTDCGGTSHQDIPEPVSLVLLGSALVSFGMLKASPPKI